MWLVSRVRQTRLSWGQKSSIRRGRCFAYELPGCNAAQKPLGLHRPIPVDTSATTLLTRYVLRPPQKSKDPRTRRKISRRTCRHRLPTLSALCVTEVQLIAITGRRSVSD